MDKICSKCESIYPLDNFHKDCTHRDGLRSVCKQCAKDVAKKYAAANREKAVQRVKQWRLDNPGRRAATEKEKYRNNPEYRAKIAAASAKYGKNNRHKTAMWCANRYVARKQTTPGWADKELMEMVYAEASHRKMQVDHIIPLRGKNVCGLHVYYNTQLLTKSQNSAKHNKWVA